MTLHYNAERIHKARERIEQLADGRAVDCAADLPDALDDLRELAGDLVKYGRHQAVCATRFRYAKRGTCTCGWVDRRAEVEALLGESKMPSIPETLDAVRAAGKETEDAS